MNAFSPMQSISTICILCIKKLKHFINTVSQEEDTLEFCGRGAKRLPAPIMGTFGRSIVASDQQHTQCVSVSTSKSTTSGSSWNLTQLSIGALNDRWVVSQVICLQASPSCLHPKFTSLPFFFSSETTVVQQLPGVNACSYKCKAGCLSAFTLSEHPVLHISLLLFTPWCQHLCTFQPNNRCAKCSAGLR